LRSTSHRDGGEDRGKEEVMEREREKRKKRKEKQRDVRCM